MIGAYSAFSNRVDKLQDFLGDSKIVEDLLGMCKSADKKEVEQSDVLTCLSKFRSDITSRRIQTYACGIILMYGLFEQFVEEIIVAYLDELTSIVTKFDDLPEKIQKNHTNLSAQLLLNRDSDKYRDRCTEDEIVKSILSCRPNNAYRLNSLAYTEHRSNFRIDMINQSFDLVGIGGMAGRLRNLSVFRNYYVPKNGGLSFDNQKDDVVFADLNDLAWRRNQIAHGWPENTLSIELMVERAEFILILGKCIYQVLEQSLFDHIAKFKSCELPPPIKVYRRSIVCFRRRYNGYCVN